MPNWPDSTPASECDRILEKLRGTAPAWLTLAVQARIELLDAVADRIEGVAAEWVSLSCRAKGIAEQTTVESEEWLAGPWAVLRWIKLMRRTLADTERHGSPRLPGRAKTLANGQVAAPVFPTDPLDKILFRGITAEVWMERGVTLETLSDSMGWMYRGASEFGNSPMVSLVLGAGNVSSIAPLDALYELFARGAVVILKTNAVNSYLGGLWNEALGPLIDGGYLSIVHGSAATGEYLCRHPVVDRIHVTGSNKTYDAIVWGTGDEGRRRKESGEKRVNVPVSAELGNVSPMIVVPGKWSKDDIEYQASNVAASLVNNAGFNCLASRVVVTAAGWPQRREFLDAVGRSLMKAAPRAPYYPGALERHVAYLEEHPQAKTYGPNRPEADTVPWTIIEGVDPRKTNDICFQEESWCGVMAETGLPSEGPEQFIKDAIEFCNDTLWGTLNATLIVHPKTAKAPKVAAAVEDAIRRLRYGTVSVNVWAGGSFALGSTTWGAFPGHTEEDIRSGVGVVHNTYLFERPEKTVLRGDFRLWPRPAWFHDTRNSHRTAARLFELTAKVTPWRLAKLAWSAARG